LRQEAKTDKPSTFHLIHEKGNKMQITFQTKYKSISSFNEVNTADFVVLTGVNGSGKSQLLEAIEEKKVIINNNHNLRIVRFNFETFKLENEGIYNTEQIYQEAEQAWTFFKQQVFPHKDILKQYLGSVNLEQCRDKNISLWTQDDVPEIYRQHIVDFFPGNYHQQAIAILAMIKTLPYGINEITEEDFKKRYKPFATKQDFLPTMIGKVIWDYHVKYEENKYYKYCNDQYQENHIVFTENEFIMNHGEKPWELINNILKSFNALKYEIYPPTGHNYHRENFSLKLIHTEDPTLQIDFDDLSSGERILMALVASIYKASSDQYFPDMLLLDELDASLHPSMITNMLKVIEDVFIMKEIKTILVTHSPTTIALCPEESIYIMNRTGHNRIEKKDRHSALAILTEGFITLEKGILLFDQILQNKINIFTEGHNTSYLRKALQIENLENEVHIFDGLESMTGKNQLSTLFDFFSRVKHRDKVLFVFDCDAYDLERKLKNINQTYSFIFKKNDGNKLAKKGIENLFPEYLFDNFITTVPSSNGTEIQTFETNKKRDFEKHVLEKSKPDDFLNFNDFIAKVRELSQM
jgi:ABC-type uncharacterized transport system ATPase component